MDADPEALAARSQKFWVTVAKGIHPFPSRTRKLSPSAPMVLHARVCGRVGRCPDKKKAPAKAGAFCCFRRRPLSRIRGFTVNRSRLESVEPADIAALAQASLEEIANEQPSL